MEIDDQSKQLSSRRAFLAHCGKFAIVTPPAVATLLSFSSQSFATATSGGGGGGGGKGGNKGSHGKGGNHQGQGYGGYHGGGGKRHGDALDRLVGGGGHSGRSRRGR